MQETVAETEGKHTPQGTVSEVALLALRLGFTAFGGPAAHIAMLRDEVVTRRKWVTDEHFLDLLGATNLIPGPNSTEMVIHIGQVRAGWRGMIAAGVCFIMPAALIVLVCAWAYVQFGTLPAAEWLLYGIKPVIIAIVVQALWGLAKTAVKGPFLAAIGVAVLALYLLGFNELALLFGGGILVMLLRNLARLGRGAGSAAALLPLGSLTPLVLAQAAPVSLGQLFWSFLKIGAVLYGSGYVLLAFLRGDLVERWGWLTESQLLDAIAVGQITPGPLFTTATFIGYVLAGPAGACLATTGMFLPAFFFVALSAPLLPRLRQSRLASAFLDGVNTASLALMAAVTLQLLSAAFVDWPTIVLGLVAAGVLSVRRLNPMWLVVGGGVAGLLLQR